MERRLRLIALGGVLAAFVTADWISETRPSFDLARSAHAIVGAPMTPVSYAGVARRTTRRMVAVETTEVAAASAAAASKPPAPAAPPPTTPAPAAPSPPQPQPAAAPPPAAPAPAAAPAMGTIVASLPQGCAPQAIKGVEYYQCGGVYYRAALQSNNLVYVVVQP
jgi:hypothetical protein